MLKLKLILIVVLFSFDTFAGTVFIHRRNKGLFGYEYVIHTSSGEDDRLDCLDRGKSDCVFPTVSNQDIPLDVLNSHLAQVNQLIDEGNASGNFIWSDATATWSTDESGMTTIEINFED